MSEPFDWTLPEGWEFPGGEVNIPHTLKEIQDGQYVGEKRAAEQYASNLEGFAWYGGYPLTPEKEAERKKQNEKVLAPSRRRYRLSLTGSRVCKARRMARRA